MDIKGIKMTDMQRKALKLKEDIEKACIKRGLNITIYNGKLGFVDQRKRKIVMLWSPEYKLNGDMQQCPLKQMEQCGQEPKRKISRRNGQGKELSKLHDAALDYDLDIQITTDKIAECREKMFKEKDTGKLKSIVLLLGALIYEAGQYKEWIEQMTDTNIDSEDEKENDRRMQTM